MMRESGINENQTANSSKRTAMMATVIQHQQKTHGSIEVEKIACNQ
jgi:hypothetical protein